MFEFVAASLYFMLPAYTANAAPRLAQKFDILTIFARPIDFGRSVVGKRIFGDHKTWRGLLIAPPSGALTGFLQSAVWRPDVLGFDSVGVYALVGLLLGSGAITGDLFFAFWKRRAGKKEGERWIPFDQLNFVVGALAFAAIIYVPSITMIFVIFAASGILHVAANRIAYCMGIQNVKW